MLKTLEVTVDEFSAVFKIYKYHLIIYRATGPWNRARVMGRDRITNPGDLCAPIGRGSAAQSESESPCGSGILDVSSR